MSRELARVILYRRYKRWSHIFDLSSHTTVVEQFRRQSRKDINPENVVGLLPLVYYIRKGLKYQPYLRSVAGQPVRYAYRWTNNV